MTTSFTLFNQRVADLNKAFPQFHRDDKQRELVAQGEDALRKQFNVQRMYTVIHNFENGCPEDSYTSNVGFFLSKEHAERAAEEFAGSNGYKFVTGELDYSGDEVYVQIQDLHL